MFTYLHDLLVVDSLSPHGICLLWRPELIWTHAISDLVIALAYFSIPVVLGYFASKRPDISFGWVIWCFVVFIVACGTTHLLSIWTLWVPDYGIEALVKAVTAAASVATAFILWPLLPRALALPSPAQLAAANDQLLVRVRERDEALLALRHEAAEREHAEDMLRQSQKMEALGHLTGGIAHDFNNLLTAVMMNLDRAQKLGSEADPRLQRTLQSAALAAERGARLTSQMLAFARKQPALAMDFDVGDALREIASLLGDAVDDKGVVRLHLDPDRLMLNADRNQFETAVLNLVVNARDAIPLDGTIDIFTRRGVDEDGQPSIVVEVADSGMGISADLLNHVFEPFFTTKAVGQGSGLGLSQVYGFATQSGGSVKIDSVEGQGTRVQLVLPALVAAVVS
jgi:signal transduction histidine kinase